MYSWQWRERSDLSEQLYHLEQNEQNRGGGASRQEDMTTDCVILMRIFTFDLSRADRFEWRLPQRCGRPEALRIHTRKNNHSGAWYLYFQNITAPFLFKQDAVGDNDSTVGRYPQFGRGNILFQCLDVRVLEVDTVISSFPCHLIYFFPIWKQMFRCFSRLSPMLTNP